jgi:hypothetical protein
MNYALAAGAFGAVFGWLLYYTFRYRTDKVTFKDVAGIVPAIAGAGILALFPAGTDLFAGYATGLAIGFFGYVFILLTLTAVAPKRFAIFINGPVGNRGMGGAPPTTPAPDQSTGGFKR